VTHTASMTKAAPPMAITKVNSNWRHRMKMIASSDRVVASKAKATSTPSNTTSKRETELVAVSQAMRSVRRAQSFEMFCAPTILALNASNELAATSVPMRTFDFVERCDDAGEVVRSIPQREQNMTLLGQGAPQAQSSSTDLR